MAPTLKILSFPEILLVELFQELRGTLWRMYQVLGVAGFCGEIILKSEKMTIYIRVGIRAKKPGTGTERHGTGSGTG